MLLVTRTGVGTCLSWWTRMSVVGKTIVLMDASDVPGPTLVVTEEASVEEARRLLVVIEDRARLRARRFDTRSWNGDAGVNNRSTRVGRSEERDEA
jgi:hypothetical protein